MSAAPPPADDPEATELLVTQLSDAAPAAASGFAPGMRLGAYRLDALLGQGGMGEVYRAEQLEPVRRTVALKLLRGRRLDARHLAYFEIERQLLAQMRHPAIAQIYDAGTTVDGVPYFAMEFSEGVTVTRFCAEQALSLRERLALFLRICEGVQHAHHKGVIHRDLKPGNLLVDRVDGRPMPKIIDFGIAMVASRSLDGTQERAGTPDYMSPEQAAGDVAAIDTRSDVYALGVLLHELVAGGRPGEDAAGLPRLASQTLDTLPPDSPRLAGMARAPLRRALRSELDWVVAKAMQAEREDRYASVGELAADVRRFLQNEPLLAVPSSRRYRTGKFIGRHRTAMLAASVVLCALLAGLGLSVYGLMQAREQRALAELRSRELERVAGFQQAMLEDIDIEAMGSGLSTALREQLAEQPPEQRAALDQILARASTADVARRMIDRDLLVHADAAVSRDFSEQPALAADLRESIARVHSALGMPTEAAAGFARVAEFRTRAFGESDPRTLAARRGQADALLSAGHLDAGAVIIARARPLAQPLPLNDPTRVGLALAQADVLAARGDREGARKQLQTLYDALMAAHGPRDLASMDVLNALANQQRNVGDMAQARANMEKLVPLRMAVQGAEHKDTLAAQGNLAVMRMLSGEKEGAVQLQRELVATQTRRLGAEHPITLHARSTLGSMLSDSGQAEEALPLMMAVLAARERVLGAEHPLTLRTRLNLATTYARLEDFKSALPLEQQVLEARTRLLGASHPDTLSVLINHAGTLLHDGQAQACLALLDRAIPLGREVMGAKHPQWQRALLIRADAYMDVGQNANAIAAYRELLEVREHLLGAQHPETIHAAWNLVDAYESLQQDAQARVIDDRYLQPLLAAEPGSLSEPLAALAGAMRREGRQAR
jgi:non-specific serine/threonine protein kinase/serine/threonine-protein kinase